MRATGVDFYYAGKQALHSVALQVPVGRITALIGPSGCGKTTFLRILNRMYETVPQARPEGEVLLDGEDIFSLDVVSLRRRVGMVFQKPNPFPTMSIFDNVVAGLRLNGIRQKKVLRQAAEAALHHAALWDIVKDRLTEPATRLSGGQQQRLCVARALAVEPEILLMDEPCSALDPIATARIEALITELSSELTIVLVTHNMFQARRVSDRTAVFLLGDDRVGELVEEGPTDSIFRDPADDRTREYVSGHVG
jgi:phosphate transport system ATP-binding protein